MMKKYKGMSIREDVAEKIQKKAKDKGIPISTVLNELLEEKERGEEVTKSDLEKLKKEISEEIRQVIREEVTAILEEAKRW